MTDPFLQHAASYLRDAPEPGWDAVSSKILAAVHATIRTGRPIRATRDISNGVIYISEQALRSLLARELRRRFICQPTRIDVTVDGSTLRAIDIDVTGSYGTQLRELGDDIGRTILHTVGQIIDHLDDSGNSPSGPIDITITDVVEGDPLH